LSLAGNGFERDCVLIANEGCDLGVPKDEAESDVEEVEDHDTTLSAGFKCARHSEMCSDPGHPPRQLSSASPLRSGCQPPLHENELFLEEALSAGRDCCLPWRD
jgi:hypothetical protein